MKSAEFKKWLITVRFGNLMTVMPTHDNKELPTGTVKAIKKQLGLKK